MTLSLDQRRRVSELKAEIKAIESTGHNPKKLRHKRVQSAGEGQREPRQVLKDHKGAVARLFCIATFLRTGREVYGVQVAHQRFSHAASGAKSPGLGRKSHDWRVLPLSHEEHALQHRGDEAAYWASLGMDENAVASLQRALFAVTGDHEAMLSVLRGVRRKVIQP